jgi:hypothetical protein
MDAILLTGFSPTTCVANYSHLKMLLQFPESIAYKDDTDNPTEEYTHKNASGTIAI